MKMLVDILSRLTVQGKTLVDAGQIDRLRKAVKDLNSVLGDLGG